MMFEEELSWVSELLILLSDFLFRLQEKQTNNKETFDCVLSCLQCLLLKLLSFVDENSNGV